MYTILSNCYYLRETSFFKNFKKNNHNLIKKYKLLHSCNVHFYNAFTMHLILYKYLNKFLKLEKLVRNICIKLLTCIHVSPQVREFNSGRCQTFKTGFWFLLPLIIQNKCSSKFRSYTTNSGLLKPTIFKFRFMFIKFRYNLFICVHLVEMYVCT